MNPATKNGTHNGTGQKTSTTSLDTRQNACQAKRDTRRASSKRVCSFSKPRRPFPKPSQNYAARGTRNCAGCVPRPAALAPKHIRELLGHLKKPSSHVSVPFGHPRETTRHPSRAIARDTPNHENVKKIEKPKKNRRRKIDKNIDLQSSKPNAKLVM